MMGWFMGSKPFSGFTLAELLIALGILAVIATFTIPKVLNSNQDAKRAAVLKETFSAVQSLIYQGVQNGEIRCGASCDMSWVRNNLNAIRVCNHSVVDGCWDNSYAFQVYSGANNSGVIMPNGAYIVGGLEDDNGGTPHLTIDWNGLALPNVDGEDQISIRYCATTTSCTAWGDTLRPGTVMGLKWGPANSNGGGDQFYRDLW